MKIKKALTALAVVVAICIIFIYPDEIKSGIINGLSLCAEVTIPSMFIFAVIANFAAESEAARLISLPFSFIFAPLFNIPKQTVYAVIMSFLSGYPIGAAGVAKLYSSGEIDRSTANRMLAFCVNASPPTVIVAIGGLLGSYTYGWIIFCSHITASVLIGVVTARFSRAPIAASKRNIGSASAADCFVNATASACHQMIAISGYVVMFCAISEVIGEKFSILLEVTSGAKSAISMGAGAPSIAGLIGFGGIAVICQVMSAAKDIASLSEIIFTRIANGVLSAAICTALLKLVGNETEVISNLGANEAYIGLVTPSVTVAMLSMAAVFLATVQQKKLN